MVPSIERRPRRVRRSRDPLTSIGAPRHGSRPMRRTPRRCPWATPRKRSWAAGSRAGRSGERHGAPNTSTTAPDPGAKGERPAPVAPSPPAGGGLNNSLRNLSRYSRIRTSTISKAAWVTSSPTFSPTRRASISGHGCGASSPRSSELVHSTVRDGAPGKVVIQFVSPAERHHYRPEDRRTEFRRGTTYRRSTPQAIKSHAAAAWSIHDRAPFTVTFLRGA